MVDLETLIEDDQFDHWCMELVELMKECPDAYSDHFDFWFNSFTGETGYHLPLCDDWVYNKASYLIGGRQRHDSA